MTKHSFHWGNAESRGDIERHTSRAVHQLCLSRAGSLQSVSSGDDQAFFPLGQCRELLQPIIRSAITMPIAAPINFNFNSCDVGGNIYLRDSSLLTPGNNCQCVNSPITVSHTFTPFIFLFFFYRYLARKWENNSNIMQALLPNCPSPHGTY